MTGNARHMFAGSNTPLGFYSFFDHIWPNTPRRKYIIKGGPGTGKSTLLKKVGQHMQDKGYDVEYFHCSSDDTSLDAIRITDLEVCMVDGTAPHIQEPELPGAVDKIINLGDFWDEERIIQQKNQIADYINRISMSFSRCYRFLQAAGKVYEEISIHAGVTNFEPIRRLCGQIISIWFTEPPLKRPSSKIRRFFASAITPSGCKNFLNSLMDPIENKYILKGAPGTGKSSFLKLITQCALDHSFDIEVFHCSLNPQSIDHVIIPGLNLAFITSSDPHQYHSDTAEIMDFNQITDSQSVLSSAKRTQEDRELYKTLLTKALTALKEEKELHDHLESLYSTHMDFSRVEAIKDSIINEICPRGK
jgi:hypothetical protein